ncbi:nitrite reductase small subunit NirD [Alkalicoccus halolimnae]|uniref:Nitrite reductase small subunit NirD n=1 Tax=Alkalicoccus halolimnae TaxID=1667239 RepID=A0A5C7F5U4_9BACI|nr:nitrite reductase small subunit NirD [Alkalicoccus halolimnae]TXF84621.1 nitrite reductase small subunit NirD [Alkalicoccus halolimnae]
MEKTARKVDAGPVEDFTVKIGKEVLIGDLKLAVFRLAEDEFHTIKNECPHKKGPLTEGMISGEHVFCPLHNWKIDITDGQVEEPDEGCVQTFKTEIIDNNVYITV